MASLSAVLQLTARPAQLSVRTVPESAKVTRTMRSAQSAFENFRRNRLPRGESGSGTCDVRIGRYCYWRGDEDEEKEPPEAVEIVRRRDQLIAQLDTAAIEFPGDAWIAGQQIRYLAEAKRTDDALAAAARCRASAWWCSALGGYVAHTGGRYEYADSSFRNALSTMDASGRCRWLDISDLLDDGLKARFRKLGCDQREAFARHVFFIGAPLLSVSVSDLLTEHFSRLTRAKMAEHSASADGDYWADDERGLVLRYGWPKWFTQSDVPFGSQLRPSIVGHDAGMPYYFLPSVRALDSLSRLGDGDWNFNDPRAPSGYAPSYARSVHEIPGQIAVFRRGDSALVVGAWDARRDTTLVGRELDAALVVAVPDEIRSIARASGRNGGRLSATAFADSGIVSLELLSREDKRAGRLRVGFAPRPKTRVAVSDMLFYAPTASPPTSLGVARDSALATLTLPRNVGVFWETYGLDPKGEKVHYTLRVEQFDVGLMRRLAERMHLADPTTELRLQWEEMQTPKGDIAARGVSLDLSRLRGGHYRVELTAAGQNGSTARTIREIQLR